MKSNLHYWATLVAKVLLLLVLVSGCSGSGVVEGEWELLVIGLPTESLFSDDLREAPRLELRSDGVSGYTGCNLFSSPDGEVGFAYDNGVIEFGELFLDLGGCAGELPQEFENAFRKLFAQGAEVEHVDQQTLRLAVDDMSFEFERSR
jgi:heat shock protein HslJ